jgi:hypothetical protein
MVSVISPLPPENNERQISAAFMLTDPRKISSMNNTVNIENSSRKAQAGFPDELYAISVPTLKNSFVLF